MASWTAEEHETLIKLLVDGVSIQSLCKALPNRTEGAIVTRSRKQELGLNFRTSRRDGKLYEGVSRRDRTNRKEAIQTIVGEPRTTTNSSTPTTSPETISTESADIVAKNDVQSPMLDGLRAYKKAILLLAKNKLPVKHEMVCILSTYILEHSDKSVV